MPFSEIPLFIEEEIIRVSRAWKNNNNSSGKGKDNSEILHSGKNGRTELKGEGQISNYFIKNSKVAVFESGFVFRFCFYNLSRILFVCAFTNEVTLRGRCFSVSFGIQSF